jgi:hypothetical protein
MIPSGSTTGRLSVISPAIGSRDLGETRGAASSASKPSRAGARFALNELLGQDALGGLPRAGDHNSRHHRQPIGEGAADQTGKSTHVVDDFHSPRECLKQQREPIQP